MNKNKQETRCSLRALTIFLVTSLLATVPSIQGGTIRGNVTVVGGSTNADAVVYVEAIPDKSFPPPSQPAKMDQIRLEFTPKVLPVQVGTTVEFHNSDSVSHNVFTVDACADSVDLGTWTKGETRSHTFTQECKAVILCNLHPEMEAWIVAVPTPYFAVSDADGSYAIEGVPDGTYTVKVWHPDRNESSAQVTVAEEAELNVSLESG